MQMGGICVWCFLCCACTSIPVIFLIILCVNRGEDYLESDVFPTGVTECASNKWDVIIPWEVVAIKAVTSSFQLIFILIKEKMASTGAAAEGKIKRPPKVAKPKWADDGPKCLQCDCLFGATIRRRHCRMCGDLVCANCAPNERPILEFGYKEAVRVCLKCFNPPKPIAR